MDSNNLEEFRFVRFCKHFSSIWGSLIGLSVLFPYIYESWIPIGGMENAFLNGLIVTLVFVSLGFLLGYLLGEKGGGIFYHKKFGREDFYGASILYGIILTLSLLFILWEVFYIVGYLTESISPFNDPTLLMVLFYIFLYLVFMGSVAGFVGGLIFGLFAQKYLTSE